MCERRVNSVQRREGLSDNHKERRNAHKEEGGDTDTLTHTHTHQTTAHIHRVENPQKLNTDFC